MRQEYALAASGDDEAAWSVEHAAEAARWVCEGRSLPASLDQEPAVVRAHLALRYGRIPARWTQEGAGSFAVRFCAAVRGEEALQVWLVPVLAAGLFGVPREERASLLEATGTAQPWVRRTFQVMRTLGRPSEDVCVGAGLMLRRFCVGRGEARARACEMLAGCVGWVWIDELRVLAQGRGPMEVSLEGPDATVAHTISWWSSEEAWVALSAGGLA